MPLLKKKIQAAQVYFPIEIYMKAKLISKNEGKPLATWVRELVVKEVNRKSKDSKKFSDLPTFSWKNVNPHFSEHLDDILYDSP